MGNRKDIFMNTIQFNKPILAEFTNATVCNEPLFLHVETKVGDLADGVTCTASPFAFCVESELIDQAKTLLGEYDVVEIGDERDTLIRFVKAETGNIKRIQRRSIASPFDFFEESEKVKMAIIYKHIGNGVVFASVDGVVISPMAVIGKGTEIHGNVEIRGKSDIGEYCVIGPSSVVSNSKIGDGSKVISSHVYDSTLDAGASVGPFAHVKVGSRIATGTRIGAFVEVKNSDIGENTAALHLTYIGDSTVGSRVNFGCGTITCNYDGKNKHRTTIGNNVFIGCNTNLVAPVTLADGSFTAAGSTITDDLPAGSLGIARAQQTTKEGWADKKRAEGKLK